MAEKILQTRIINKHTSYDIATTNEIFVPKKGEIVLAQLDVKQHDGQTVPTFLMKVGDGEKNLKALNWLHAPASDVYAWAKQPTLEYDALPETLRTEIDELQAAIGGEGSVADMIKTAIEALDVDDTAVEKQFVTAVAEADGKISVSRRALTADDIPELAIGKIAGLQGALDLKANAADVKDTTDAISARLDSGDIKQAIDAAQDAADAAKTYAESIYKAGEGDAAATGVLAQYMTSNDAALAEVRGIADAAQTAQEVADAIDAKIEAYDTATIDPIDTRLTTVEGKVSALSSATHFLGVKDALPTEAAKGDIVIVGNKEYVYDPEATVVVEGTYWVELGDTTAELEAIDTLEKAVEDIQKDLGADGDTTKAIEAAHKAADDAQADADEALRQLGIINSETAVDGSLAKVLADAKGYADDLSQSDREYTDNTVNPVKTTIEEHIADKENPHEVTKGQVGLGKVDNMSVAEIKAEFTGEVAEGDEGFVTGGAAHTAVKSVTDDITANVARVKATEADGKTTFSLVVGADEDVIIFDCGGVEAE